MNGSSRLLMPRAMAGYGIYLAIGVFVHLIFYGVFDSTLFTILVLAFWPVFLLFELVRLAVVFMLVIGIIAVAAYVLMRFKGEGGQAP